MCSYLSCYLLKTGQDLHKMLNENLTVNKGKKKLIVKTQNGKKSKYNTEEHHQNTREEGKRRRTERNYKKARKLTK